MYNEDVKRKFIVEFTDSISRRNLARKLFNNIERYEVLHGSDFYTMSKNDIEPMICEIVGARSKSQETPISILKEYIRWCKKNNFENVSDGIFQIDRLNIGMEKFKRQMVANPHHLQMYLNCICDEESKETVDCIHRCFYWLAYSGMVSQEDAVKVTKSNVKLGDMLITYNNREYELYRESIPAFRNCKNLKKFRIIHPNYTTDAFKDRENSDILLSGVKGPREAVVLRSDLSRMAKAHKNKAVLEENLDLNLSYQRVWLSGVFYRTMEVERIGIPVDFKSVAKDFMECNKDRYENAKMPAEVNQRNLAREYKKDYERWKEAYSI